MIDKEIKKAILQILNQKDLQRVMFLVTDNTGFKKISTESAIGGLGMIEFAKQNIIMTTVQLNKHLTLMPDGWPEIKVKTKNEKQTPKPRRSGKVLPRAKNRKSKTQR